VALLVGMRGVGKSIAARRFAAQCRRQGRPVATVSAAGLSPRELLWQIAAQWSLGPQGADDAPALLRRLADFAAASQLHPAGGVLLLDDAEQAGPDLHAQLARLLALAGNRSWLTLVLTASPSGVGRLGEQLLDAVDLRVDLEPWTEAETVGYVQHALVEAGCDQPVFDDEALTALYHLSDGVPRRVNRVADHALLLAAAEGHDMVNALQVETAHDALGWMAPTPGKTA
jgi:type II secretory pathway predicted ATPase ExeA